jgi:hypothetical protein
VWTTATGRMRNGVTSCMVHRRCLLVHCAETALLSLPRLPITSRLLLRTLCIGWMVMQTGVCGCAGVCVGGLQWNVLGVMSSIALQAAGRPGYTGDIHTSELLPVNVYE